MPLGDLSFVPQGYDGGYPQPSLANARPTPSLRGRRRFGLDTTMDDDAEMLRRRGLGYSFDQARGLIIPEGISPNADPSEIGHALADAEQQPDLVQQAADAKLFAKQQKTQDAIQARLYRQSLQVDDTLRTQAHTEATRAAAAAKFREQQLVDFTNSDLGDELRRYDEDATTAQQKLGMLRAAFDFQRQTGDPTPEAEQAQQRLQANAARYDALKQRRDRLARMADEAKAAHDQAATRFGELNAAQYGNEADIPLPPPASPSRFTTFQPPAPPPAPHVPPSDGSDIFTGETKEPGVVGTALKNAANAFARSAVSGIGEAAKGAVTLGNEMAPVDEYGRYITPELGAEFERRQQLAPAEKLKETVNNPAFQWGNAIEDAAKEVYKVDPGHESDVATKIGGSAGGFVPLLASGPAAPVTMGLQTVGSNLERTYADQLAAGKTPDEAADHAINRSLADGAVQAALFEVLPKPLRQLGDAGVNAVARGTLSRVLAERVAQGFEGAALGGATTAASNVVEGRPVTEGVGESAAGLGAMQMLMPRGGAALRQPEDIGGEPARPPVPDSPSPESESRAAEAGLGDENFRPALDPELEAQLAQEAPNETSQPVESNAEAASAGAETAPRGIYDRLQQIQRDREDLQPAPTERPPEIGVTRGEDASTAPAAPFAENGTDATSVAADKTPDTLLKPLPDNARVTIQEPQGDIPGYQQIDLIKSDGESAGSFSPEDLRDAGYQVPDLSALKTGQYSAKELAGARPQPKSAAIPDEPVAVGEIPNQPSALAVSEQRRADAQRGRIRDDLPEAKPIIDKIDEIVARGVARQAAMSEGQWKDLTHPMDMLTSDEKTELHQLHSQLRPKSRDEARVDVAAKRAARIAATKEEATNAANQIIQPQGYLAEHQNRNSGGQAAEAGRSDRAVGSAEERAPVPAGAEQPAAVAPDVRAEVAVQSKRPWEMTAAEWNRERERIRPETFGSAPQKASISAEVARTKRLHELTYGVTDAAREKMQAAMRGDVTLSPEEVASAQERLGSRVTHRDVVEKALAEGKAVPPAVLAEYPDLTKTPTESAAPLTVTEKGQTFTKTEAGWTNADGKPVAKLKAKRLDVLHAEQQRRPQFDIQASTPSGWDSVPPEPRNLDLDVSAAHKFVDAPAGFYRPHDMEDLGGFESAINEGRHAYGEVPVRLRGVALDYRGQPSDGRGLEVVGLGDRGTAKAGEATPAGTQQLGRFHRALELAFGKRIVFFEPSEPIRHPAFTSPLTANTIFVDATSDRPFAQLVGHELGHNLRAHRPDLWEGVRDAITAKNPMPAEYAQEKAPHYKADKILDEWVNDHIGERFAEPEFWREVAARDKNGRFKQLTQVALDWVKRLATRLTNLLEPRARAAVMQDVEHIRKVIADAVVKYGEAGPYKDDPGNRHPRNTPPIPDAEFSTTTGGRNGSAFQPPPDEVKNGPVPGEEGKRYRSHTDTLRQRGYDVARQVYAVKPNAETKDVAEAIIKHLGEDDAARFAADRDNTKTPPLVRMAVGIELSNQLYDRVLDPKLPEKARALAKAKLDALAPINAELGTDLGQAVQYMSRVSPRTQAIKKTELDVGAEQDRKLGPDGKQAIADATKKLNEATDKALADAAPKLAQAARDVTVTKSIWQQYRDDAASRLVRMLDNVAKESKQKPPLQEFTKRLVDEMRARLKDVLPEKDKPATKPTAMELIREAVENREKYRDVFDTVREKFVKEFGEGSPAVEAIDTELAAIGEKPYSARLQDRAIRDAHRAMGVKVVDIARMTLAEQGATEANVADALVKDAGLKPADAARVAADLKTRMGEITADVRKRELEKLLKSATATAKTHKVLNAIEQTVRLNNLGAFSDAGLRDAVAKKLDLPTLTIDRMKELSDLAAKVSNAKSPTEKARASLELLNAQRVYRGFAKSDVATAVWYANLLSGYTTQAANAVGNLTNSTLNLGTLVTNEALHGNGHNVANAIRGWLSGFGEGWQDASAIMKSGAGRRDFETSHGGKVGTSAGALELVDYARDFNVPAVVAKGLNAHAAVLKQVFRFMKAADALFYYPAKEAYTRVAVAKLLESDYRGKELRAKVRETLQLAPEQYASAVRQAESEGVTGLDKALRVADIIDERRAKANPAGAKAVEGGKQFGLDTTYNNDPRGWAGVVYHGMEQLTNNVRPAGVQILKPFLPFLRVPTNVFNASLNYTPVGTVRAFRGMVESRQSGPKLQVTRKFPTADERAHYLIQSIGGTMAMAGLYGLAGGYNKDDKTNHWFSITGTGPTDFRKQAQLRQAGWRDHALKFGDTYISYKDTPFLIPLSYIGGLLDAKRYQKPKDDLVLQSQIADAVGGAGRAIFDSSMLQGLTQLLEYGSGQSSGKRIVNMAARIPVDVGVPLSNFWRQVDRAANPEVREADAPGGPVTAATPFARNLGSVRTDVLGEPVQSPPSARFGGTTTSDPLRRVMLEKNLFISTPDKDTKFGKNVMTPEEYTAFVRQSGEAIRRKLEPRVDWLLAQPEEKIVNGKPINPAQHFIEQTVQRERDRVKDELARARRRSFVPAN